MGDGGLGGVRRGGRRTGFVRWRARGAGVAPARMDGRGAGVVWRGSGAPGREDVARPGWKAGTTACLECAWCVGDGLPQLGPRQHQRDQRQQQEVGAARAQLGRDLGLQRERGLRKAPAQAADSGGMLGDIQNAWRQAKSSLSGGWVLAASGSSAHLRGRNERLLHRERVGDGEPSRTQPLLHQQLPQLPAQRRGTAGLACDTYGSSGCAARCVHRCL